METISGSPQHRTVLALVAHDAKKQDLLRLVRSHQRFLIGIDLLATGTTGRLLSDEVAVPIETMASGPKGGDLQIGARIAEGRVDALVFLRDPLTAHPHEPDIQALLKVCDVHDVPVATNVAAAEILLHFLAEYGRGGRADAGAKMDDGRRRPGVGPADPSLPAGPLARSTLRSVTGVRAVDQPREPEGA
jgi:methylglyoxal synthase